MVPVCPANIVMPGPASGSGIVLAITLMVSLFVQTPFCAIKTYFVVSPAVGVTDHVSVVLIILIGGFGNCIYCILVAPAVSPCKTKFGIEQSVVSLPALTIMLTFEATINFAESLQFL